MTDTQIMRSLYPKRQGLLGSGLVRLPSMTFSASETFVFEWLLRASDGDDLETEIDAHTFTYLLVDPSTLEIVATYTDGNGLTITPSTGSFLVGGTERIDAGYYHHFMRGLNNSTNFDRFFFDGKIDVLQGID